MLVSSNDAEIIMNKDKNAKMNNVITGGCLFVMDIEWPFTFVK
ncbi:MAG: hypothetical protein WBQ25_10515 [Nitrososphaeraceae archaeon]